MEKVQASESSRDAEGLENIWTGLKDCLLQAIDEVCGRTGSDKAHCNMVVQSECGKTSSRKTK